MSKARGINFGINLVDCIQAGTELPASLTFDYPTVAAMAKFIAGRVAPPTSAAGEAGPISGDRSAMVAKIKQVSHWGGQVAEWLARFPVCF